MNNCLAWPVCLDDARSWLAGRLPDHELMLSAPGPVFFVYHLQDGLAGWKALAAALGRCEARYGQMSWGLCRSTLPGVTRLFSGAFECTEDRWLIPAKAWRDRLHALNSARPSADPR